MIGITFALKSTSTTYFLRFAAAFCINHVCWVYVIVWMYVHKSYWIYSKMKNKNNKKYWTIKLSGFCFVSCILIEVWLIFIKWLNAYERNKQHTRNNKNDRNYTEVEMNVNNENKKVPKSVFDSECMKFLRRNVWSNQCLSTCLNCLEMFFFFFVKNSPFIIEWYFFCLNYKKKHLKFNRNK